jgi:hypothetical protein
MPPIQRGTRVPDLSVSLFEASVVSTHFGFPSALDAGSLAIGPDVGVLRSKGVTSDAVGLQGINGGGTVRATKGVLLVGDSFQVVGIPAIPESASLRQDMVKFAIGRNGAYEGLVGDDMDTYRLRLARDVNSSIAVTEVTSTPPPARVFDHSSSHQLFCHHGGGL